MPPIRSTDSQNRQIHEARAAGFSGGTGFAGLVLLLPQGLMKSALLAMAPAFTVAIGATWHVLTNEIDNRVADWRLAQQRRRVEDLLKTLPECCESRREALKDLEA